MFLGGVVGWFLWGTLIEREAKRNPMIAVDLHEAFFQAALFVLGGAVAGYAVECFL